MTKDMRETSSSIAVMRKIQQVIFITMQYVFALSASPTGSKLFLINLLTQQ